VVAVAEDIPDHSGNSVGALPITKYKQPLHLVIYTLSAPLQAQSEKQKKHQHFVPPHDFDTREAGLRVAKR
jgi:hypothetical protein